MAKVKYVAEGFTSDAQKLLKEFADCESLEYELFSSLWKKHNFGLIFMGRPTEREFREFVNEIYELTLNYFDNPVLEFQVGAIYLLYALFLNQTLITPIYIRITQHQYQILLNIIDIAEKKRIGTLYYVIDYLLDNCLECVAFPSMFGPCTKKTRKDYTKPNVQDEMFLTDVDQDLITLHESNILNEMKDMHFQYQNLKENLESQKFKSSQDIIDKCDDFKNQLESLLNVNKSTESKPGTSAKIGSKRAKLKKSQFERKVIGRLGNCNDHSTDEAGEDKPSPSKSKKVVKRKGRKPPSERRIGRPKKFINITPTKSKNCEKPLKFKFVPSVIKPKRRGPIGRKKVSYLKPYDMEVKIVMDEEVSDLAESSDGAPDDCDNDDDDDYELRF